MDWKMPGMDGIEATRQIVYKGRIRNKRTRWFSSSVRRVEGTGSARKRSRIGSG